jgi:surfeit locus 1 family protein
MAPLTRRLIFPVLLGLLGCAVLIALGVWQLQRLAWKEAILADIAARITAPAVDLPAAPDPSADRFLPVTVTGALGGEELHVLTSADGPGYRVIAALTAGDRRVMVDLGFVPEAAKDSPRMAERVEVTGNLHWPDETDRWTPPPDAARGIWFARDVPAMAAALGTEPVLIVARRLSGADLGVTPMPVDTAGIRNDHREYAITWFLLAAVWAAMSGLLIARSARARRI